MTILWFGGEDIDFPNGTPIAVRTASSPFRSGYARCGLNCGTSSTASRSLSFSGGAVTSAWLHFQAFVNSATTTIPFAGLGLNSAGNGGIFVGSSTTVAGKCALYKWDGTTLTQLATETGTSLPGSGAIIAIDVQISSYGASSTVNVYVNNNLVITFSGSTAISGISNLDCAAVWCNSGGNYFASELIVADADTRSMSLVTMALNATGDANNWTTGTFASINPVTINDANVIATYSRLKENEPMATGVNVSKGNLYGALSPPTGDGVSKANLYAALSPPIGVNVSKANLYAVLVPAVTQRPMMQVCG
jgi:hypothetical protein